MVGRPIVLIIPTNGSKVGLMVPIIPFDGSIALAIFTEALSDGTIASITKALSNGVVMCSISIRTSSGRPLFSRVGA